MDEESIGSSVVDCAIKVHSALGPGLLESAYEACLAFELRKHGFAVERQLELPVRYCEVELEAGFESICW